jgi:hypothetical protein
VAVSFREHATINASGTPQKTVKFFIAIFIVSPTLFPQRGFISLQNKFFRKQKKGAKNIPQNPVTAVTHFCRSAPP